MSQEYLGWQRPRFTEGGIDILASSVDSVCLDQLLFVEFMNLNERIFRSRFTSNTGKKFRIVFRCCMVSYGFHKASWNPGSLHPTRLTSPFFGSLRKHQATFTFFLLSLNMPSSVTYIVPVTTIHSSELQDNPIKCFVDLVSPFTIASSAVYIGCNEIRKCQISGNPITS